MILTLTENAAREAGEIAKAILRTTHRFGTRPMMQAPSHEADLDVDVMLRDQLLAARPDIWLAV